MNNPVRGAAALLTLAVGLLGAASAGAQDKTALATERDKVSYMVGMDIAHSIAPAAQDLDMAEFRKAVEGAIAGKSPAITPDEARATGQALMQRIAARNGHASGIGAPPAVDPAKVADLIGSDIGRSLVPIKDQIDLPTTLQALATALAGKPTLLDDAQADAVRKAFASRLQAGMQQKLQAAAGKNDAEGGAFLAGNGKQKGVFTTASGLQYRVLRQGAGGRPQPGDTVRVNYRGSLLDGNVFDSSYDRGQPEQFKLDQVIKGWAEGLQLMPVGSKYRFWIPAALAYGAQGTPNGPIGPNATLVFDVELLGIQ